MNYPVPNITTPSFSLKRQYDEIAPVKNSKNVDVKFTPGTGWMLEQYHETVSYVHDLQRGFFLIRSKEGLLNLPTSEQLP